MAGGVTVGGADGGAAAPASGASPTNPAPGVASDAQVATGAMAAGATGPADDAAVGRLAWEDGQEEVTVNIDLPAGAGS